MKNMLENEDIFEAYVRIDFRNYVLQDILKTMEKPTSPLERMIDDATGHGKADANEKKQDVITLLNDNIEDKKMVEADYSMEEKMLKQINEI